MTEPKQEGNTSQATSGDDEQITVKVMGPNRDETVFKIKRSTKMSKLMKAYYKQQGLQENSLRFRFEGEPINEEDTAADVGLESGDSLDAFVHQVGGN